MYSCIYIFRITISIYNNSRSWQMYLLENRCNVFHVGVEREQVHRIDIDEWYRWKMKAIYHSVCESIQAMSVIPSGRIRTPQLYPVRCMFSYIGHMNVSLYTYCTIEYTFILRDSKTLCLFKSCMVWTLANFNALYRKSIERIVFRSFVLQMRKLSCKYTKSRINLFSLC